MRPTWCLLLLAGCASRHAAAPSSPSNDHDADAAPATLSHVRALCDLPDRIVTVDDQVHVLVRPGLEATTAPISKTDHLGDRCDGPDGGYAGCSMTYDRYWSTALGDRFLEVGTNEGNVLEDVDGNGEECRNQRTYDALATCSTADWFLQVTRDDEGGGVLGELWTSAAEDPQTMAGAVDDAGRYQFAGAGVTLTLDDAASVLEVGTAREPCAVTWSSSLVGA